MKFKYKLKDFTLKENTDFWIIVFNSFVYYMLAILTVIVSSNAFSLILGKYNNFSGKLFYYGFLIQPKDGHCSHDDISLIFMFGLIFTLFFAILFERLYKWRRGRKGNIKLYFLWCYILAITWFLGNIIVGAFSNFSIGSVLDVMRIPMAVRIMLAIAVMVLLFFLGRLSRKHVLLTGSMYFKHLHSDRNFFLVKAQLLFPAILGILVYFIYRTPHQADYQFRDALVHLTVFIFVLGVFWGILQPSSIGFKKRRDWVDFDYWALGILLVVSVFLRIYLGSGFSL
jgi:hypothetical protein